MKTPLNGVLLINKPEGLTSHDVVARMRRFLNQKSVGHAGTLDPMATGLLVILLGQATKLSDFVLNGDKSYRAKVRLGIETDTLDITGETLKERPVKGISQDRLLEVCRSLEGSVELSVPIFSAVKVDGKRLHRRARAGEDFIPPKRVMEFRSVEFLGFHRESFDVQFSTAKGGFVRSWAAEFGSRLGTGACLEGLKRLRSEPFSVEGAITLSTLSEWKDEEISSPSEGGSLVEKLVQSSAFVPLVEALPHWQGMTLSQWDEKLLRNGQISSGFRNRMISEQKQIDRKEGGWKGVRALSESQGVLVGLIELRSRQQPKIRKVFPLTPQG